MPIVIAGGLVVFGAALILVGVAVGYYLGRK